MINVVMPPLLGGRGPKTKIFFLFSDRDSVEIKVAGGLLVSALI
jgi:hypothetical protein